MNNIKQLNKEVLKDDTFLNDIDHIRNNEYSNINQIKKLYDSIDNKNIFLYGMLDNQKTVGLMVIDVNKCGIDDCFLSSIECFVSGKGYGKQMIDFLIEKHPIIHWMCNPDMGKELYKYYNLNFPFCNQYILSSIISVYNKETVFFYRCPGYLKKLILFKYYNSFKK